MATDAVHANDLITGIIAELKAHLPANWLQAAAVPPAAGWKTDVPLKKLEFGDLWDYPVEADWYTTILPAIFVRPLVIAPDEELSGACDIDGYTHHFRVVHLRGYDQCYTDAGAVESNMTRARGRYAKLLNQALFYDPKHCMSSPTISTLTGYTAKVASVERPTWDIGVSGGDSDVAEFRRLRAQAWAISVDFAIKVEVTP